MRECKGTFSLRSNRSVYLTACPLRGWMETKADRIVFLDFPLICIING